MDSVELLELVPPQRKGDPRDLHGLDEVWLDGKRVGFLPHCEGAVLRFVGLPEPDQAEAVRAECARLRAEAGRWPISDRTIQPPEPSRIVQMERVRRRRQKL